VDEVAAGASGSPHREGWGRPALRHACGP
jgi:hypothetical protein